ncbi:hypothetical protein LTR09_009990 [Extremus antarcticus]|uniref:Uncharacterized protein n=1 Tax=Extremus antarcticus TaxID=702011 RepID=A0AAJ0D873_9PEZI|nr:hypothetical protein LTR09_009990 [Extremus antarcticus]
MRTKQVVKKVPGGMGIELRPAAAGYSSANITTSLSNMVSTRSSLQASLQAETPAAARTSATALVSMETDTSSSSPAEMAVESSTSPTDHQVASSSISPSKDSSGRVYILDTHCYERRKAQEIAYYKVFYRRLKAQIIAQQPALRTFGGPPSARFRTCNWRFDKSLVAERPETKEHEWLCTIPSDPRHFVAEAHRRTDKPTGVQVPTLAICNYVREFAPSEHISRPLQTQIKRPWKPLELFEGKIKRANEEHSQRWLIAQEQVTQPEIDVDDEGKEEEEDASFQWKDEHMLQRMTDKSKDNACSTNGITKVKRPGKFNGDKWLERMNKANSTVIQPCTGSNTVTHWKGGPKRHRFTDFMATAAAANKDEDLDFSFDPADAEDWVIKTAGPAGDYELFHRGTSNPNLRRLFAAPDRPAGVHDPAEQIHFQDAERKEQAKIWKANAATRAQINQRLAQTFPVHGAEWEMQVKQAEKDLWEAGKIMPPTIAALNKEAKAEAAREKKRKATDALEGGDSGAMAPPAKRRGGRGGAATATGSEGGSALEVDNGGAEDSASTAAATQPRRSLRHSTRTAAAAFTNAVEAEGAASDSAVPETTGDVTNSAASTVVAPPAKKRKRGTEMATAIGSEVGSALEGDGGVAESGSDAAMAASPKKRRGRSTPEPAYHTLETTNTARSTAKTNDTDLVSTKADAAEATAAQAGKSKKRNAGTVFEGEMGGEAAEQAEQAGHPMVVDGVVQRPGSRNISPLTVVGSDEDEAAAALLTLSAETEVDASTEPSKPETQPAQEVQQRKKPKLTLKNSGPKPATPGKGIQTGKKDGDEAMRDAE